MLGAMRIDGPRGFVPMRGLSVASPVGPRIVLIGEAAHAFPPIGAQGLNLGLRDAAALRDSILAATADGRDPGSREALSGFARSRALDARLRTAAVDTLNRSLLSSLIPVDALRGLGLLAMTTIGPLRRVVMREGCAAAPRCPRSDAVTVSVGRGSSARPPHRNGRRSIRWGSRPRAFRG